MGILLSYWSGPSLFHIFIFILFCKYDSIDNAIIEIIQDIKAKKAAAEAEAAANATCAEEKENETEKEPVKNIEEIAEIAFPFPAIKKSSNERKQSAKPYITTERENEVKTPDRRPLSSRSTVINKQAHQVDSGFNESTDTTLVTPPNGKINFDGEKMPGKRSRNMPEVVTK